MVSGGEARGARGSQGCALAANLAVAAPGLALLLAALLAGPAWAERHFLPAWAWDWGVQLRILLALRICAGVVGLGLLFGLRPWLVRACRAGRGRQALLTLLSAVLAMAAGFAVAEAVVRTRTWRSTQERWGPQEPLRAPDPVLGWRYAPSHQGSVTFGGRRIDYAANALGYRARATGDLPDPARPTIVVAGESILYGYGLPWPDGVPAQVERLTGIQTVDIAVNAHATDQTLLRLRRELGRFADPVAIVVPFVPVLFDRNLDRDRPHLDAQLRWHPAERPPLRLVELARRAVRFRTRDAIAEGTEMTRAALVSAGALARSRGSRLILVVPQFAPETPQERRIRAQVLDAAGLDYRLVLLPAAMRDPDHRHPNARGARAIAEAIAAELGKPAPAPIAVTAGSPPPRSGGRPPR